MNPGVPPLDRLAIVVDQIRFALSLYTGLDDVSQKIIAYWTIGTHAIDSVQSYPLLMLMGKMGTGKSQALRVIETFSYKPQKFNLRGITLPVFRNKLACAAGGTAIVEEADYA